MIRRSRRKVTNSPSLFPFLAVLICTMGAIIVLLVLVVKNADVQAQASSEINEEALAQKKQKLRDQLELESSQVETLHELRPELKSRLAEEKATYGHLADHVSRLKLELDRLRTSVIAMDKNGEPTESEAQQTQEIENLKRQIAAAKQDLENRRLQYATAKPTYSIIPQSGGGNGTFRRPIFVECSAQGVTLQPYNITLQPADFPSGIMPGNPLDVALLMIRDYWNQIDPKQSAGQPYPLFVIRPSGSRAFAAARKAMKSWVDEFGYELVTADIDLEYPEADTAFKQRLVQAIEQSRIQQQNRVAAINRQQALSRVRSLNSSSAGSTGFRASSITGGFVREGNTMAGSGRSGQTSFANSSSSETGTGQTFSTASHSRNQPSSTRATGQSTGSGTDSRQSLQSGSVFDQSKGSSSFQSANAGGPGGPNGTDAGSQSFGTQSGTADPELPSASLARQRGTDWALPSKANNSILVSKPIKVQVDRDGLRIVEIGKGIKSIPFRSSTADAIPDLVEQVWKHIDAWGIAGINSYWKPTLNLYVAPDAQARFNELQILLSGSGLDVRRIQP